MPRQVALRLFLALALLLAQQAAIGHQYWHASAAASAAGEPGKAPKGERLCELHDLLGTVLGAVSGAAPLVVLLALAETRFVPAAAAVHEACLLTPHSRDPPLNT